ncbi:hypothetical protein TNCV_2428901 [Trichonephila clavipes]|nr:hypothetical protein TNCV_2428901 [Trichonephila clavipes]
MKKTGLSGRKPDIWQPYLQKGAGTKEMDNTTRPGRQRQRKTKPTGRVRQPEGFPEEWRNSGIESIPQNNIRRRSLGMEALDGDPVDRSE